MGARLRAKRLASDLDLISSSGSLPVQPVISGHGQYQTLQRRPVVHTKEPRSVQTVIRRRS